MNTLIFILILALFILPFIRIKVTKIPLNEAPKELRDAWLKRHPAKAWKVKLSESFQAYINDFNENMTWWGSHVKELASLQDVSILVNIKKTVTKNLDESGKHLKEMSLFGIWIKLKVLRIPPDKLVRKTFGQSIQELYTCMYLIKEGRKFINCQYDFTDDEILSFWRKHLNLPMYKPIFSKKLLCEARAYGEQFNLH